MLVPLLVTNKASHGTINRSFAGRDLGREKLWLSIYGCVPYYYLIRSWQSITALPCADSTLYLAFML